ncbi:MAG: hemolysin family protein [Promicromonosporaceae bacterium]|nr:hemolysin family protein [Promicromonosporaceae bacterium]
MITVLAAIAVLGLLLVALLTAGGAAVLRVTRASLAQVREASRLGSGLAAENRFDRATTALALAADPARTVAAVAIVRVTAQVVAIGAFTLLLARLLAPDWGVLLALVAAGLLAGLLLGRWSPRQMGFRRPRQVLLALSGLLTGIVRLFGWAARPAEAPAEDDPQDLADRTLESGVFADEEDKELIRSAFELGGTLAREVMVPRTDMVTVPADLPLRGAFSLFMKSGHSRLPVTDDDIDDIRGVAYLKDVVRHLESDPDGAPGRPITDLARAALFIPESKPIDDLLREMQSQARHLAIVIDEYGGVAGLVTLEDVLEELVGQMRDEHDRGAEDEPEEVGPGVYRVPARFPVDEVGDLFGLRFDDDEVDTVAGLLAKALGKVPLVGDSAEVGGLRLTAETVIGRRKQVATLLVTTNEPKDTDD